MVAATILNENQRLTNKMLEYEKLQENMNLNTSVTFVIPAIISIAEKKRQNQVINRKKFYYSSLNEKEVKYMAKKKCNKLVHVKAHNRCRPGTHKK